MRHERDLAGLPAGLQDALADALDQPPARVRRVAAGTQAVWLKQAERLSLRWRMQKGDARRAFEADRAGLQDLAALGLPVAPILAEGQDFFVTAEVGRPLAGLLLDPAGSRAAERVAGYAAGGAALAALHRAGVAHGRPSARDICWDGRVARLIDFERYRRGGDRPGRMVTDLLILLHSILVLAPVPGPELQAALDGWRAGAPAGLWPRVQRRVRRLAWAGGLARLVLRWRPKSRDLVPVPVLLDWLCGQDRAAPAP